MIFSPQFDFLAVRFSLFSFIKSTITIRLDSNLENKHKTYIRGEILSYCIIIYFSFGAFDSAHECNTECTAKN